MRENRRRTDCYITIRVRTIRHERAPYLRRAHSRPSLINCSCGRKLEARLQAVSLCLYMCVYTHVGICIARTPAALRRLSTSTPRPFAFRRAARKIRCVFSEFSVYSAERVYIRGKIRKPRSLMKMYNTRGAKRNAN